MRLRTIWFSSELTVGRSISKFITGCLGCPLIFIIQFTLTLLFENEEFNKTLSGGVQQKYSILKRRDLLKEKIDTLI
jgi:hypothetical protein